MKRTLFRYLLRYLHVLVTCLVVASFVYVIVMQRVTITTPSTSMAVVSAGYRSFSSAQLWKESGGNTSASAAAAAAGPNVSSSGLPTGSQSSILLAGVPRSYTGYLTIGIPTLKRPKGEYFFSTLGSLLQQSSPAQQRNMTLVVMLADRLPANNDHTLAAIKTRYSQELSEGLLLVASAPDTEGLFHQRNLKRTFNDSLQRVQWRSKQNLDYAALMEFSARFSKYYLQIEDDVTAAPNFMQHVQSFVEANRHEPWAGLEVCPHGFIGKLFRSGEDLAKLVALLRTFYLEMPCDFLIRHFYNLMLQRKIIRRKGNLFFHQGKYSSLANVTRKTDRAMAAKPELKGLLTAKRHAGHVNPHAQFYTSIEIYQGYSVAAAYDMNSRTYFWGKDVKDGDDITVVFASPQKVSRILVHTGINNKAGSRRDFIRNGTVEVGQSVVVGRQKRKALCTDTRELGSFFNGHFNQSVPRASDSAALVRCFTIVITQAQKEWVAISEIAVYVQK